MRFRLCDSIQQSRIDTKKGVLYRLNNLPSTHASEEKEPESDNAKEGETQPPASVDAGERTDVPDKSVEEGDGKKEEKESIEEEESIADDKKNEEVLTQNPTELSVLCTAPRDNVITYRFFADGDVQGNVASRQSGRGHAAP